VSDDWRRQQADRENLGNTRAAADMPSFPREFTPEQRLQAYWACIQLHCRIPTHTSGWYAMLNMAHNRADQIKSALTRNTPAQTGAEVHASGVQSPSNAVTPGG